MEQILNRFLEAQNRLVFQSSDLSLDSIAKMVENRAIDIDPHYQRRERWGIEKQSALIESFLLNIPVPPIYLAEDNYGRYSVIDGKQRVTAINKFILHNLKLNSLEKYTEIEGFEFADLPEELRNALTIRPYIRVVTLLKQSDPNLKYEVFTRLNTGGEKLLAQEIRNVAYQGNFNDLIYKLSEQPFLKQQLKITSKSSKAYKEMIDAEYVLRFFTLKNEWRNFSGNMRNSMDRFMQENQHLSKEKLNLFNKNFIDSLEVCKIIWGKHAFMRPGELDIYRSLILQGFYDVQMVPISIFTAKHKNDLIVNKEKIKKAFAKQYKTDIHFQDSIRQFTSNPQRTEYRIGVMIDLIKAII